MGWGYQRHRREQLVLERMLSFKQSRSPASSSALVDQPVLYRLQKQWGTSSRAAALRLRIQEFVGIYLIAIVGLFLVGWIIRGGSGGFVLGVIGFLAVNIYFRVKQKRWINAAEQSLPDFLRGVAGALRAGSSLQQALAMVGKETPDPLGGEILRVLRREALGFSLEQILEELSKRVPSRDLSLAIIAINIQREIGGSLSEILENIVRTIVDRQRLKMEVQSLTAQGRYSGWVLTALPFGVGLMIWLSNPSYLQPLMHSPIGWMMIGYAVGSVSLGGYMINRMARAPEF